MADKGKRIHVIKNPAAGQDEPVLNVINDVCRQSACRLTDKVTTQDAEKW